MSIVTSINPANGLKVAEFPAVGPEEMDRIVNSVRVSQRTWIQEPVSKRVDCLSRLASLIEDRSAEVIDLMHLETGKLHADGEPEVLDVVAAIRHHIEHLPDITTERDLPLDEGAFPGTTATLSYAPFGVIGLIMPWNFPFYVPSIFTVCALLSGNGVVIKPSEHSTMVAQKIVELIGDAGFPRDLVQVAPGADDTGGHLVKSSVDKLFFVGSIEAGKDIISNAGVTPVQVELGGNSAAIVLDDANLATAVGAIAWGGTYHSGQDCMGIKRVFVQRAVAPAFIEQLTAVVGGLRQGVDYGPYISPTPFREAKRRIDDAVAHGAKLLCGGELDPRSGGYWLTPSVLLLESQDHDLVRTETFGNVLPIQVVDAEDDAIDLANNTHYGLSNAIFSTDIDRARRVATRVESGMVFINDAFVTTPGWDYAVGWRNSGFGTMESKLMQCVRGRLTTANTESATREFWYPY